MVEGERVEIVNVFYLIVWSLRRREESEYSVMEGCNLVCIIGWSKSWMIGWLRKEGGGIKGIVVGKMKKKEED